LPEADRDRGVLVGARLHTVGQKDVTGHSIEELEDLEVVDAASADVLDELSAISGEADVA
jgi:hypothetical protein